MTASNALQGLIGLSSIAALTWFFSYHPRLFIRVFVPREDLRGALRGILRDPNFGRGMRLIGMLQFGAAALFGLISLWLLF